MEEPHDFGAMAEAQRGRCVGCGLLSTYIKQAVKEVSWEERGRTEWLSYGFPATSIHPYSKVTCFVSCCDLDKEARDGVERLRADVGSEGLTDEAMGAVVEKVIGEDRHCPEWFPYTPKRSPSQHVEAKGEARVEENRPWFEKRKTLLMAAIGVAAVLASVAGVIVAILTR